MVRVERSPSKPSPPPRTDASSWTPSRTPSSLGCTGSNENTFQIPKSLIATAYHEAGHAVADRVLGFRVKQISIVRDAKKGLEGFSKSNTRFNVEAMEYPTRERRAYYHDYVVALFSGEEAQRRFSPRSVRNWQGWSDRRTIIEVLTRMHGEGEEFKHIQRYLWQRARNLVNNLFTGDIYRRLQMRYSNGEP